MSPAPLLGLAAALLLAACDGDVDALPESAHRAVASRADPDAALATKVETALGTGAGRLPYGVEVTATHGRVDLWGVVPTPGERDRFVTLAAGVVGVQAVADHLQVEPGL